MKAKTLKELHAQARNLGIKGYSKLSHATLEHRLARAGEKKPDSGKKSPKKPPQNKSTPAKKIKAQPAAVKSKRPGRTKKPAATNSSTKTLPGAAPVTAELWATGARRLPSDEQRIENAKYATVPPGGVTPSTMATDLGEDIDHLPPISEPMVCLLPQKPGVLHGYWVVPPGSALHAKSLKLRLGRLADDALETIEEIDLPREFGHWYFHLDDTANINVVYLQLGYYAPDGRFITASHRGMARIPSLFASQEIDRLWWISEEKFRAMYLRAGGLARGARLGWASSISSPGAAAGAPSERFAWPGNISS
ncbi:MAG: hypothetical protein ACYC9L_15425 [Sulfuricaulis sp.]